MSLLVAGRVAQAINIYSIRPPALQGLFRTKIFREQPHIKIPHRPYATHMHTTEKFGNFDLVRRFKLDFTDVTISKWRSRITGLSVVHLDYEAPIVDGYFVVATEIFDDSGCPHTLEHLVFMGSEQYPYKGILDLLANRGFAQGTNAWTANDHTAYTISTAGEQGFLQMLPIYVDHILYPTLTKAGFITEVHHIDAEGKDSGVVYSEMQGRQNTSADLMNGRLRRLVNPPGSAYRSETGGLMEALRILTPEQIRQYHATYYVPHNLSLIVTGKLSSGTFSLLEVVQQKVEPSLISHGQNNGPRPQGWRRPFIETESAQRSPIQTTLKEIVEFPEKDENMGELVISFLGPPLNEFLERKALSLLGTYMTSSAVAPLNKEYIEIESPLCSYIYFGGSIRANYINLSMHIGSIPTERLVGFNEKIKASFEGIIAEGIDMDRMAMVLNRNERQLRSVLESAKGDTLSRAIISDFLYGADDGSYLTNSMDMMNWYAELRQWSNKQWSNLLQKYYVDPPSVVVCGQPSSALAEKLEQDEKARIAQQVETFGSDGLERAKLTLEMAKAEHDKPVPQDILTSFPVPNVKSISWIPVQSVQERGIGRSHPSTAMSSTELSRHIENDGSALPFFVQYDHVESDFVSVHVLLSLAKLPTRLRPYITAYLSAFFSLPVKRHSGEYLTHEQVINKLDDETVGYTVGFGLLGSFTEMVCVSLRVETAQYEAAVAWLKDLIYGSEFNADRLQIVIAKIQQSLPEMKRDGSTVLRSLWADLIYDDNSTSRYGHIIQEATFVPKLAKQLQASPAEVIADFEEIRKHMTDPSGIRFSVTGNVLRLKRPRSTLGQHFAQLLPACALSPVPFDSEMLSEVGRQPVKKAIIMGLPTTESSYAIHATKSIQGFNHPELPVLRVAVQVLNATEGYLWRYIRGSGLAYSARVSFDVEAGLLSFTLYRSSNSMSAFQEAAKVLRGIVDGSIALDQTALDAAKSSIVYSMTNSVSSSVQAATVSFVDQALKGCTKTYRMDLLEKYQAVSKEDVLQAFQKYLMPLFDPASSVAVVVTATSKVDETFDGLDKAGFLVERRTLDLDPGELGDSSNDRENNHEKNEG